MAPSQAFPPRNSWALGNGTGGPLTPIPLPPGWGRCYHIGPGLSTFGRRCQTKYCCWWFSDYRAKTYMLTWDEDLAYRRMLDLFYETEKPLPANRERLYRLLNVAEPNQKVAVENVLKEYWRKAGGRVQGFVQQRASKDIANYRQTRANRVKSGKLGGLARSTRLARAKQTLSYPLTKSKAKKGGSPNYKLRQDHAVGAVAPTNTAHHHPKGETANEKRQRLNKAALESAV